MKTEIFSYASKGAVIGASMIIPGVSGGTTAIVLGIYDRLISSVSSFFKSPKKNFLFLTGTALGGIAGLLLFSKVVLFLLKLAPMPMTFLFIGAVIGSLPLLFKQAGVKGFTPSCVLFPLAGISLVALTAFIPADLFAFGQQNRPFFPLLFAAGVFISAALVLPGISASYMLLILGLYQPALNAVEQGNLTFLLSLGAGVLAGVILCTKLLGAALVRFPRAAYLTIIGFVIASVKDVFPGVPCGVDLPLSALTFLSAAAAVYFVAQRAEN